MWYDQLNGVENVVVDYFKTLFQSEEGDVSGFPFCLDVAFPMIKMCL